MIRGIEKAVRARRISRRKKRLKSRCRRRRIEDGFRLRHVSLRISYGEAAPTSTACVSVSDSRPSAKPTRKENQDKTVENGYPAKIALVDRQILR